MTPTSHLALLVCAATTAHAQSKAIPASSLASEPALDLKVAHASTRSIDPSSLTTGSYRVTLTTPSDLVVSGVLRGATPEQLTAIGAAARRGPAGIAGALKPVLARTGRSTVGATTRYVTLVQTAMARFAAHKQFEMTVLKLGKLEVGDRAHAQVGAADLIAIDELILGRESHLELRGASAIVQVTGSVRLPVQVVGTTCPCLTTFHTEGEDGSDGRSGEPGSAGTSGRDGRKATCGIFDDRCATAGGDGGRGVAGQEGAPGGIGAHASNLILDFRALAAVPSGMCVVARGGRGGSGGAGGGGGRGGSGGEGGKGNGCEYGAKGGNGGAGGSGGNGGRGGDSGDGGEVTILIKSMPLCLQIDNAPGAAGAGGQPGAGGQGGHAGGAGATAGTFSADSSCDRAPGPAKAGSPGGNGIAGPRGERGAAGTTQILAE